MQVQNNKEEVPFAHYEEKFRALDPIESAKRCGVPFADGKFSVRRVFLCRFIRRRTCRRCNPLPSRRRVRWESGSFAGGGSPLGGISCPSG